MSTVKHTIEPNRHLNPLPPTPYPPQKVSGFTRFRKVTLKSSGRVRTPGPPGQLRAWSAGAVVTPLNFFDVEWKVWEISEIKFPKFQFSDVSWAVSEINIPKLNFQRDSGPRDSSSFVFSIFVLGYM